MKIPKTKNAITRFIKKHGKSKWLKILRKRLDHVPGAWKGKVWMSKDFNDELPLDKVHNKDNNTN